MWTCLQAKQTTPSYISPAILGSIVREPTLHPMAGTRPEEETWRHGRTVIRASDFVLEGRESAQCDFTISARNICDNIRDTWPCPAHFYARFRRQRWLVVL